MPKFLNRDEIYRILQRTLPPDVYPDQGPVSGSFSMSDHLAISILLEDTQGNAERIYDNFWPQIADENIMDWEILLLGKLLPIELTLAQRHDRLVAKVRTRRRTTPDDILQSIYTVLDSSVLVELVEWGCTSGGWTLDVSQLEISTYLNGSNRLDLPAEDIPCPPTAAAWGITQQQFEDMQEEAYTYEVRIYSYTLTTQERIDLEAVLIEAEPARSQHIISDGLDPADMIDGTG